jgi:hypothetical protein
MYAGTAARYLNPKSEKPKPSMVPPPERIPKNPHFASVQPRYQDPKAPGGKPSVPPPSPFLDEKGHKSLSAKIGFGAVPSKYKDIPHVEGLPSPRELVEQRKQETLNKSEKGWRSPRRIPHTFTFDDEKKLTEARLGSPKRSAKDTVASSVKEYIRSGTPIPHHSQRHPPVSAKERLAAMQESRSSAWHSAGVSSSSFIELHKKTLASRPQYSAGEERAREQVLKLKAAKVHPKHAPRVALLAPAYQLALSSTASEPPSTGASPAPDPPEQQHEPSPEATENDQQSSTELKWSLKGKITF